MCTKIEKEISICLLFEVSISGCGVKSVKSFSGMFEDSTGSFVLVWGGGVTFSSLVSSLVCCSSGNLPVGVISSTILWENLKKKRTYVEVNKILVGENMVPKDGEEVENVGKVLTFM